MEQITGQGIILMQGPPACGKSTLARKHQGSDPDNIIIVSRDAIRHGRGKYWVPSQEQYISAIEHFSIEQGVKMGYTVIVDATNMNAKMIDQIKVIAKANNIPVIGCMVHATLEACIKRDINENREHSVGQSVIKRFYSIYAEYCDRHNLDITKAFSETPYTIHTIYSPENATDNN